MTPESPISPTIAELNPKEGDLVMLVEQGGCSQETQIGLYFFDRPDGKEARAFYFSRAYYLESLEIASIPFPTTVPSHNRHHTIYGLQAKIFVGKKNVLFALKEIPVGQPYFAFIEKKLNLSS